jgi:cold shock CspA family protein
MPNGTVEWFSAGRGRGFVVAERSLCAIVTVKRAGSGMLDGGQHPDCEVTRDRERRSSAVNLRPVQ